MPCENVPSSPCGFPTAQTASPTRTASLLPRASTDARAPRDIENYKILFGINGGDPIDFAFCLLADHLRVSACGTFYDVKVAGNLAITNEETAAE